MDILNGIKNFLSLINDNWTTILVIVGLALALWKKIESYSKLSTDKKIEIAKKQISENILKLITQAEKDYAEWENAGSIKRSEVISEIYKEYPILAKVVNQEELVKWIDEQIDNALPTLRDIIKQNEKDKSEINTKINKIISPLKRGLYKRRNSSLSVYVSKRNESKVVLYFYYEIIKY